MTIEQKALERRAEEALSKAYQEVDEWRRRAWDAETAHEADKARHAAEMREQAEWFSEACEAWLAKWKHGTPSRDNFKSHFWPYVPIQIDPLLAAAQEVAAAAAEKYGLEYKDCLVEQECATALRAALDARGLSIVKKGAVNG